MINNTTSLIDEIVRNPTIFGLHSILTVKKLNKGVVHHVWEVITTNGRFYIKIRGNRFAKVPEIKTDPHNIFYEYKAIHLLYDLMPDNFPQIIYFDKENAILILSDATPEGADLESLLIRNQIDINIIYNLSKTLRKIHNSCGMICGSIRLNDDRDFFDEKLNHKIGFRKHKILEETIYELRYHHPRQIIIGDPSPKNIGINNEGKSYVFFDLEDVHRGNAVFDYGFLIGHLILHCHDNPSKAYSYVNSFIKGYGKTIFSDKLPKIIALSTILYRLHSIVPYCISFSNEKHSVLSDNINNLLYEIKSREYNWQDFIERILL